MSGAIRRAEELKNEIPGAVILGQFVNPANPAAHERTTGEEIWRDTEGKVDIFIAGAGTGGTVSGVGRCLKAHNPEVKVIAVEPLNSPVLSGGKSGKHKIQGIGAGFIPETYDGSVVDEVRTMSDSAAIEAAVFLAKEKGLLVGISSGAAFYEAWEQSKLPVNAGKTIVVLLPDTGERYLSTGIFG
jgi:cysteine synthase A